MYNIQSYKAIVVDDHRMFAESFCELLKKVVGFESVDLCYSIDEARQKMLQQEYNYLFIDLLLPGSQTREFIAGCRKLNEALSIIVVSSVTDPFAIKELFGTGIHAYLSKSAGSHEIKIAMEATMIGEKYVSTNLAGKLATAIYVKNHNNLTKKEIEVIQLVAKGHTIAEAAQIMNLSTHTIVGHRRNIMQKLGVRSATEIVKFAYENKLF